MLHFIMGGPGSGKTTSLLNVLSQKLDQEPHGRFLVLVPDQFTSETERLCVEKFGGIMRLEVLSFMRLGYRAMEDFPSFRRTILSDTGKNILLRRVFEEEKEQLTFFQKGIKKPGFLDEFKSLFSELSQYGIRTEADFERMETLGEKFVDIHTVHTAFRKKLGDSYELAEELLVQLAEQVPEWDVCQNAYIFLDGFTGFTPNQYELLRALLAASKDMYVTVNLDHQRGHEHLFSLSYDTLNQMNRMASSLHILTEEIQLGTQYCHGKTEDLQYLQQELFHHAGAPYEKEPEGVQYYVGKSEEEEILFTALKVYDCMENEGYKPEEIAVILSDPKGYGNRFVKEMERLKIPYFMDRTIGLNKNPLYSYFRDRIQMVLKNYNRDVVVSYLRNPLSPFGREEVDLLENYLLATGIRGMKGYEREWGKDVKGISTEQMNELRERILENITPCHGLFKKKVSIKDYVCALYDQMEKDGIFQRLLDIARIYEDRGDAITAGQYERVYEIVLDVLEEMVSLMGDVVMDVSEFEELLLSGLEAKKIGFIPAGQNQVQIGDITRTRLRNIRVLFFVGFREDQVPRISENPGIINLRERKMLRDLKVKLAPLREEKLTNDLYYLYLLFSQTSERLYFTCSTKDQEGQKREMSFIFHWILEQFPKIKQAEIPKEIQVLGDDLGKSFFVNKINDPVIKDEEEQRAFLELYRIYYDEDLGALFREKIEEDRTGKFHKKLDQKEVERLYRDGLKSSVTNMEIFAKCPYSFFLKYGVRLRERPVYEIQNVDLGNMVHDVMEGLFYRMKKEGLTWKDLTDRKEWMEATLSDLMEEEKKKENFQTFFESNREEFQFRRIQNMLKRAIYYLSKAMGEDDFEQDVAELRIALDPIPFVGDTAAVFVGKIDRIDVKETQQGRRIRIVDYKTGTNHFDMADFYYGVQLQLILYLSAVLKKRPKDIPEGVYYQMIRDRAEEGDDEKVEKERSKLYQLKGIGLEDVTSEEWPILLSYGEYMIRKIVGEIGEGNIKVEPFSERGKQPEACEYCNFHTVCGIGRIKNVEEVCRIKEISGAKNNGVLIERMKRDIEDETDEGTEESTNEDRE